MSTPDNPNPFATPDPQQLARNIEEQQRQQQYSEQQQYAAQQQWTSQHWQGQNQPTYPPGYQPQYLYQQPQPGQHPYVYQQQPPAPGTATAALVTGIVSVFAWFLGIVAVITGILALRKIKRTGASGRGLALSGLIIGISTTTLTVAAVVGFIFLAVAVQPASVHVTEPQTIATHKAVTGHCLDVLPETASDLEYSLVPCADVHSAEIIQTRWMSSYPVTAADEFKLAERCYASSVAQRTIEELGADNFELFFVLPKKSDWEEGLSSDDFHCLVTPTSGSLRGSLTDGTATLEP